jgi:hypothetical protein
MGLAAWKKVGAAMATVAMITATMAKMIAFFKMHLA